MSDLPSSILFQQAHARPKTGEELEVFGKQAASKYMDGDSATLTEAVSETIKHAGLSPEQVKRVVEFANVDAYLQEFKKEGADHKVIEFHGGPANVSEVLKELNSGGGGTVFDSGRFDYDAPPQDVMKTAALNATRIGFEETKLAEMFQVEDQSLPYADPLREALDLKDKLASVYDSLSSDINVLESNYYDISSELFNQVKQAALSGVTLGQIVSAWSTVTDAPEFVKAAFVQLSPRLLENGVFPSKEELGNSLMKTAAVGVVNKDHPIVEEFGEFCATLCKLAGTRIAQEEIAVSLDQLSVFLKQAATLPAGAAGEAASGAVRAGKAVRAGFGKAKQVWDATTAGARRAAVPVREFTETATGSPLAGSIAGGAVKYAPHAAGAIAAGNVYDELRWSPAVQTVKNVVLSQIPYTQPWMMKQYDMARQMY